MSQVNTRPNPRDVCITIDMEPDCPPFLWTWRGMTEGAPRLLDMLAQEALPTTCFTTGETARQHPAMVQRMIAEGHELACHGMTHTPFPQLDRAKAEWEIAASSEILRAFAPVSSFRAPNLMFPDAYLDILEANGYRLDSSQAKYKKAYWKGSAPTGLTRIPASMTSSVLRLPPAIRDPWLRSLKSPVVLFCHPWEFVDLTREKLRLDCRFRTGAPALSDLRSVIGMFRQLGARFRRMDELVRDGGPT